MHQAPAAAAAPWRPLVVLQPRTWSALGLSAGYVALYLLLDRISDIEILHGLDITPWQPEPGLSMALLLTAGLGYAPVVVVAALLSSQLLPHVPVPLPTAVAGALVTGICYTAAAAALRYVWRIDPPLHRSKDIVALIVVVTVAAGLATAGAIALYTAAGLLSWGDYIRVSFGLWIGNAIGSIVLAPLLLVLIGDPPDVRGFLRHPFRLATLETAVQWASIAGALALLFGFQNHRTELFYLLFLPLVWIAARRGLGGATWAVLTSQVGLIFVLEIAGGSLATIRTFQLLMFAVATTGLMLGAFVSERHRVARALADSRSHLATILNTARDGVLTVDAAGRIGSVNPSVEQLFGRPAEALLGRDIRDLIDIPTLAAASGDGSPSHEGATYQEVAAWHADGSRFPIELTVGRFGSPGREHSTLVIRDITARRDAETRARAHESELAHATRLTFAGEMASALAHELNQPLTAIAAYARGCLRLLRQSDSDVLKEGICEVVQQAERAADVIARLRDFLRTGALRRAAVPPRELVDRALALVRAEAAQGGIEIGSRVPADLPPVLIDRIHIEQVILNLVRNAMDAMAAAAAPRRIVTVRARRADPGRVEITIADSGPGVSDEVVARLFQPFVTTKPSGMGLGLTISHSMVEAHGGQLRLVGNSAAGAAFAFDLPMAQSREAKDVR